VAVRRAALPKHLAMENISVEQQLARNTALQVGYVGNVGVHQTSTYDINQVPNSAFGLTSFLAAARASTFTSGPAVPTGSTCPGGGSFTAANGTNLASCSYTTPALNSFRPAPISG